MTVPLSPGVPPEPAKVLGGTQLFSSVDMCGGGQPAGSPPHEPALNGGGYMGCGYCHDCMTPLRPVLDGEEWCPRCDVYRRYPSHGWADGKTSDRPSKCVTRWQSAARGVHEYAGPDS